jgi:FAD/FMN-containing dehydrogenase
MTGRQYLSWGRYPRFEQDAIRLNWRHESLPTTGNANKTFLPFGNGRSYGDICLNQGGLIVDCRGLNRFISFDTIRGTLRCEAGVLLSEILAEVVSKGWFLPVTPGTQFVTVGGAIASDVHGKNHHRAGTFGCHLRCFELLRSDGTRLQCSPTENADWFCATIGGLGLTGLITWAEIQLQRIAGQYIDQEVIRYGCLSDFFRLSAESDPSFAYTVAWVDCLAKGPSLGRGLFIRGNHSERSKARQPKWTPPRMTFPIDPPVSLVNGFTLKLLNAIYYRRQLQPRHRSLVHFVPFFYPLDAIQNWNRMYGKNGFLQYQCVLPFGNAEASIREILERICLAKAGSFLGVLKVFGSLPSPGLLSFPRRGVTLALDFPNRGQETFDLLNRLDEVTRAAKGAVYPSKDARMSAASFHAYFPQLRRFENYIDPRFSSSFWRRVTQD